MVEQDLDLATSISLEELVIHLLVVANKCLLVQIHDDRCLVLGHLRQLIGSNLVEQVDDKLMVVLVAADGIVVVVDAVSVVVDDANFAVDVEFAWNIRERLIERVRLVSVHLAAMDGNLVVVCEFV
jgi:hypothetical protein